MILILEAALDVDDGGLAEVLRAEAQMQVHRSMS